MRGQNLIVMLTTKTHLYRFKMANFDNLSCGKGLFREISSLHFLPPEARFRGEKYLREIFFVIVLFQKKLPIVENSIDSRPGLQNRFP